MKSTWKYSQFVFQSGRECGRKKIAGKNLIYLREEVKEKKNCKKFLRLDFCEQFMCGYIYWTEKIEMKPLTNKTEKKKKK